MKKVKTRRCIQNSVKHLGFQIFAEMVNSWEQLTIFAKSSVVDILQCSEYASGRHFFLPLEIHVGYLGICQTSMLELFRRESFIIVVCQGPNTLLNVFWMDLKTNGLQYQDSHYSLQVYISYSHEHLELFNKISKSLRLYSRVVSGVLLIKKAKPNHLTVFLGKMNWTPGQIEFC